MIQSHIISIFPPLCGLKVKMVTIRFLKVCEPYGHIFPHNLSFFFAALGVVFMRCYYLSSAKQLRTPASTLAGAK